jgi:hypothetical protein
MGVTPAVPAAKKKLTVDVAMEKVLDGSRANLQIYY